MATLYKESVQNMTALILAGGRSERMCYPKPFLKFGDATILGYLAWLYSKFASRVVVVLNSELASEAWSGQLKYIEKYATVVLNHYPQKGRFYSVQLGLETIKNADYCFIQNVDNLVKPTTLELLKANKNSAGYVVPVYLGLRGHPILIPRSIINSIKAHKDEGTNLKDALSFFTRIEVNAPDDSILTNLNTPSDYTNYMRNSITAGA